MTNLIRIDKRSFFSFFVVVVEFSRETKMIKDQLNHLNRSDEAIHID